MTYFLLDTHCQNRCEGPKWGPAAGVESDWLGSQLEGGPIVHVLGQQGKVKRPEQTSHKHI